MIGIAVAAEVGGRYMEEERDIVLCGRPIYQRLESAAMG